MRPREEVRGVGGAAVGEGERAANREHDAVVAEPAFVQERERRAHRRAPAGFQQVERVSRERVAYRIDVSGPDQQRQTVRGIAGGDERRTGAGSQPRGRNANRGVLGW